MNIHGDGDGANNMGDGVVVEGKYFPKIDDQRTEGAVPIEAAPQISQQRPQGPGVCWERFLHLRSLKVLLVENDASTRQIVAALLRNCSYEVIEATNGLQAWGILEDLTNDVDLVLTEVVMPCISGVALLCKIMSHKTRKNTPVIMMSSLDSMDLVFKCLSRGAIDFLVKPIRKNELKNLWQHVWRSCQSSSGSGSDSAMQTQKCVKSNSAERSVNNTGSNDEEGNWSIGLNLGDRSDKGSGNQGSLTKQAAEVNGPQSVAPWDQIAECTNTIGAPATHSNAATFKLVSVTATGEERLAAMPRELNIGAPGTPDTRPVDPIEDSLKLLAGQRNQPEIYSDKIGDKIFRGRMNLSDETSPNKLEGKPARLRGTITDTESPQMNHKEFKAATTSSNLETNNRVTNGTNDSPFHEFSLKKLRGLTDTGATVQDDHNILRHSDLSDFSRDNTSSNAKGPFGSIKNVSSNGNSSEALKKLPVHDTSSHSSGEVSNYHCPKQGNPKERTAESLHPAAFFQSVGDGSIYAHQKVVTERACNDMETVVALAQSQSGANQQELQIQHPHHQYDHQHHLDHNMQQLQQLPHNRHNFSSKEMLTIAAHCGSSSMLGGVIDSNAGNCSMNGNASSRREAAVTKFHLKKKERCIQKKVQYQNKKRLAEDHPQIQGQFVRRKLHGNASMTSDR